MSLLTRKLCLLFVLVLTVACSTKVGNPDNDDEQEVEKDPIVLEPIALTIPKLPDVDKLDIDDALKAFLKETFVLIEVSQHTITQLNEFFVLVNEQKLAREGDIAFEKDGIK